MMLDPAAAIHAHVDAFNKKDLEALLAGFAEDAAWITGSTSVRGRDELAALFGDAMTGLLPSLHIQNLLVDDGQVACQLTETLTHDAVEKTFSIAGFYRLRDGLITSAKIYREGSAELD